MGVNVKNLGCEIDAGICHRLIIIGHRLIIMGSILRPFCVFMKLPVGFKPTYKRCCVNYLA